MAQVFKGDPYFIKCDTLTHFSHQCKTFFQVGPIFLSVIHLLMYGEHFLNVTTFFKSNPIFQVLPIFSSVTDIFNYDLVSRL